ncbi:MAG TPA: glycerol-3-phosphate dehydrogenase/oxidase, partial [Gemmatimonadales bacterium]|nr:glycerol-3-phosphate dehydrogenase/oxidase [Gemmatimonadales bacterium]
VARGSTAGNMHEAEYSRGALLERLERETFDIAIIGGGITGAGIARDAAMRGLSVALIDKGDFGSGTSGRSSRLIHGGLRYLGQGHLGLVREALRERGLLLRLAPHLVWPTAFVLPLYEDSHHRPLRLRVGLAGYDLLAGTLGIGRHRGISRERVLLEEPQLRSEDLQVAFRYFDAVTNDARLTLTVAQSAVRHGAAALNYVEGASLETTGGRIAGVNYRDLVGGGEGAVRARTVVSAAGPWTDRVRSLAGGAGLLRPTKGVHVVVPRARLAPNAVVAFGWRGRDLFAIPHGEYTYVGTTDTDHSGDPDCIEADYEDVAYILEAANGTFTTELSMSDVISAWAGLRPLLSEEGDPSHVSRDYDILDGPPGLYTICGGKLTTFRAMAQHLVDHIIEREQFSRRPARCRTAREPLPGGGAGDFARYKKGAVAALRDGWQMPEEVARRLVGVYGTDHVRVLSHAVREPRLLEPLIPGCPVLAAEAVHAVRQEMAMTLEDFLRRRSDLMLFGEDGGMAVASRVARLMGQILGWSGKETRRQLTDYGTAVDRMTAFRLPAETPAAEAV